LTLAPVVVRIFAASMSPFRVANISGVKVRATARHRQI
jgi:hypothetical protein